MEHAKEKTNILIVDDLSANLKALHIVLANMDLRFLEAASGPEALMLTLEYDLAVVLLDVNMPGMNGYEVADLMRGNSQTRNIPIIFVTAAYTDESQALKAYDLGAVDYIKKPINDQILRSKVQVFVDLFQQRRQLETVSIWMKKKNTQLEEEMAHRQLAENKFISITNSAQDGIICIDQHEQINVWNRGAEAIFGYTEQEVIGQHIKLIIHQQFKEAHRLGLKKVMLNKALSHQGKVLELVGLRKNGEAFPLEISLATWTTSERRFFSAIIRDITERKRIEDALKRAKIKAESASQSKSTFLATMSHEIRTPMNAILGMGELLKETKLTETQEWYVNTLNHSGEALLTLINDILDLSKIEAGQLTLEQIEFDLWQTVHNILEIFTFHALDKGIKLETTINADVPQWVRGDQTRLRQVLLNLVGNAIKFTGEGKVMVNVTHNSKDYISFEVSDTGLGIPEEKQKVIFQPFIQNDSSTTRKHGGTGLGLSICMHLVGLMGGSMNLKSKAGLGSTFICTIPLPMIILSDDHTSHLEVEEPQAIECQPKRSRQDLTILLVDDAEENQMVVTAYLRNRTERIIWAVNGQEAVEKYKSERFDLILMDIQMPVMDGYEATQRIRTWEMANNIKPIPIIALTAHALTEDSEKIKAAGCNFHLTKPIRKKRLLDTINQFIK